MAARHRHQRVTGSRKWQIRNAFWVVPLVWAFCSASFSLGQEPAKEFVQALRDNGYYEIAIEYLNRIEKSSLIDDSFRQQIPLEKAETLIQSVNKIRDLEKWESKLTEAQSLLSSYASTVKSPEAIASAQQYQANLSYRQGRVYLMRSESDRLTASEKEAQLSQAREHFEKSLNGYLTAQQTLKGFLEKFEVNPQDIAGTTKRRDDARKSFLTVRLKAPIVRETLADTYTDPAKRTEQLTAAAAEFTELWDKYYNFAQGLDSCLYAARTNYKLGKYKEALGFASEILNLPPSSTFRVIKRKGALVANDCWAKTEPFPAVTVIETMETIVTQLNRREKVHPEWLQVQLGLAKAYRIYADELKQNNGRPSEVNRWYKSASMLARTVSRSPSPSRDEARKLLAEWKVDFNAGTEPEVEVKTFDDAKQAARDMATELETGLIDISQLQSQLLSATDETLKTELQSDIASSKQELLAQSEKTLKTLRSALDLSDEATARDDLNLVRYLQCFSYYASERYYEAAIIGEFLLDRYPTIGWTQQSAGLVVKSYSRLYDLAPEDRKATYGDRLTSTCQRVIDRWPGTSEAVTAAGKVANLAIIDKDYALANEFLATIPRDDPTRTGLALKIGRSLWFEYRADKRRDPEKLAAATSLLTEGVEGSNPERLSYSAAVGSLLLVECHLAAQDTAKAMERLENAKVAPLDLIKQKHAAIQGGTRSVSFATETYKTAIKTFMSAMGESGYDQQQLTMKTQGVLQALKQILVQNGEPGKKQLVDIYKLLAFQLNRQFADLDDNAKKTAMAKNLRQLLGSVEKDADDGRTVLWAGSTILQIANQLDPSDTATRKAMFDQADSAFKRAEEIGFAGDPEQDSIELEISRQRALAKRGAGQFQESIDMITKVLEAKPNFLQAQIDAAETLQQWGNAENRANAYAEAMGGTGRYRDPKTKRVKNRIWGWRQMVQMTSRNEKMTEVFYRSYHGQIEAMYEYGRLTKNQKALTRAESEIAKVRKRDPEFGGGQWKAKFDALEQRIKSGTH